MNKVELKIYKHEFGHNLVMSLLRLGKEGFNHIVWDGVNSESEEEWTLMSKGEVEFSDEDIEKVLKGTERRGETWEEKLSGDVIAVVTGPNKEYVYDEDLEDYVLK